MISIYLRMYLNIQCLSLYDLKNLRQLETSESKYSHIHLFIQQINAEVLHVPGTTEGIQRRIRQTIVW